jgi:pilus assembly protein CpaB
MDRQKVLLLFAGAWVSAALLAWFVYAKTVAPQQEKQVKVAVAARDLALGALIRQSDLKLVNYPQKDVPKGAIFDAKNAINRVLLYPMSMNEPLVQAKLSDATTAEGIPSTIEPGYRAVSVQITDVSGVAGLVQPNSRVDVLFTRLGTLAEATTTTILQNVKVLAAGRIVQPGQTVDPRAPKVPVVTLLLTPDDAQKLELAKNQGKISLSLRNPLDASRAASTGPVTAEALDPDINTRLALAKRNRLGGRAAPDDPKAWQELADKKNEAAKQEAEKPRFVVDVYRGDKHVQELFK